MAEKRPVKITETILRDAHQSLIATRMSTEQMLPIIDKMDKVGYHSVECWGLWVRGLSCINRTPFPISSPVFYVVNRESFLIK